MRPRQSFVKLHIPAKLVDCKSSFGVMCFSHTAEYVPTESCAQFDASSALGTESTGATLDA